MDTSSRTAAENFLTQVARLIDWPRLDPLIQAITDRLRTEVPVAAVKMLLLARWYGLTEAALLEACQDRLSFRNFLELPPVDDGATDSRLAETYRRQVTQAPMEAQNVIHAVEAQLLASGFSIRPGLSAEAAVMAVSDWPPNEARPVVGNSTTPADFHRLLETAFFRPGEMADLLKQGESALVRGGARAAISTPPPWRPPAELLPVPGLETPPLRAVVEWPWGSTMDLNDRLKIGRDHRFCMFSSELQPYLHVSRQHAELEPCPEGVWVRDLKSRNGTFVNDEEIPKGQAYLIDTDTIVRFGPHCVLQVKFNR